MTEPDFFVQRAPTAPGIFVQPSEAREKSPLSRFFVNETSRQGAQVMIATRLVRRIHGRTRGNIYSSVWDTALYGQVPRWWTQSFQGSRRTRRCSQTFPAWRTCTCSASRTRRCMAKCPVGGRKAFRARAGHGAVVKPLRHGARVRVLHRGRGAEWRSNRC